VGRAGLVAGALLLAGCSPVYVTRSAVGHAKLSWNRKPLPADSVALKARRYAVDVVGLKDGRDYRTWSPVDGDAVTYLVYACPKDSLKAHQFWFPFIGSFPYKGFFSPLQAKAEAQKWEKKGLDAVIVPVAAYNTPLPWGDPLPEPVLRWGEGDLAELVIHELVHGTVYFRNQTGFNEALASWLAERAVEGYLSGKALEEWTEGRDAGERRAKLVEELTAKLKAVYEAKGEREPVFQWALAEAKARKVRLREPLNNAVVVSYSTYRGEPELFDALWEKNGRDWKKTLAALKALDKKDPWAALRAAVK
jgi:predicted aminopeptidase